MANNLGLLADISVAADDFMSSTKIAADIQHQDVLKNRGQEVTGDVIGFGLDELVQSGQEIALHFYDPYDQEKKKKLYEQHLALKEEEARLARISSVDAEATKLDATREAITYVPQMAAEVATGYLPLGIGSTATKGLGKLLAPTSRTLGGKVVEGGARSAVLGSIAGVGSETMQRDLMTDDGKTVFDADPQKVKASATAGAAFGTVLGQPIGHMVRGGLDKAAMARKISRVEKKGGFFKINVGHLASQIESSGHSTVFLKKDGTEVSIQELGKIKKDSKDGESEDITVAYRSESGELVPFADAKITNLGLLSHTDNKGASDLLSKSNKEGLDLASPLKDEDSFSPIDKIDESVVPVEPVKPRERLSREEADDYLSKVDTMSPEALVDPDTGRQLSKQELVDIIERQVDKEDDIMPDRAIDPTDTPSVDKDVMEESTGDTLYEDIGTFTAKQPQTEVSMEVKSLARRAYEDVVSGKDTDNLAKSIVETLRESVMGRKDTATNIAALEKTIIDKLYAGLDDLMIKNKDDMEAIEELLSAKEFVRKEAAAPSRTPSQLANKLESISDSDASFLIRNENKAGYTPSSKKRAKKTTSRDVLKATTSGEISSSILKKGVKGPVNLYASRFNAIDTAQGGSLNDILKKGESDILAAKDKFKDKSKLYTEEDVLFAKNTKKAMGNLFSLAQKADAEAKRFTDKFKYGTKDKAYTSLPQKDKEKLFAHRNNYKKAELAFKESLKEKKKFKAVEPKTIEVKKPFVNKKAQELIDEANSGNNESLDSLIDNYMSEYADNLRNKEGSESFQDTSSFEDSINKSADDLLHNIKDITDDKIYDKIESRFKNYLKSEAFTRTKRVKEISSSKYIIDKIETDITTQKKNLKEIETDKVSIDDLPSDVQSFIKTNNLELSDVKIVLHNYIEAKEKSVAILKASIELREMILSAKKIKNIEPSKNAIYMDIENNSFITGGKIFTTDSFYNTNMSNISKILDSTEDGSIKINIDKNVENASVVDGEITIRSNDLSTSILDLPHEYGHLILDSIAKDGKRISESEILEIQKYLTEAFDFIDKKGDTNYKERFEKQYNDIVEQYKTKGYEETAAKEEALNGVLTDMFANQIGKNKDILRLMKIDKDKLLSDVSESNYAMWDAFSLETTKAHKSKAPHSLTTYVTTMIDVMNHPSLGVEKVLRNRIYKEKKGTDKAIAAIRNNRIVIKALENKWSQDVLEMFNESTMSTYINTNSEFAAVQHIAGIVNGHRRNTEQSIAEYKIALEDDINTHLGSSGDKDLGFSTNIGLHYLVDEFGSFDDIVKAAESGNLYNKREGVQIATSIFKHLKENDLIDSSTLEKFGKLDSKIYSRIESLFDSVAKEKTHKSINGGFYKITTSSDIIDEIVRIANRSNKKSLSKTEMRDIKINLRKSTSLFKDINSLIAKKRVGSTILKDSIKYRHKQLKSLFDNEYYRDLSASMRNEEEQLFINGEYSSQFGFNPGAEYQREGLKIVTTRKKSDLIKTIWSIDGLHIGFTPKRSYVAGASDSILGKASVDSAERGMDVSRLNMRANKDGSVSIRVGKDWKKLDQKGMDKFRKFGLYSFDSVKKKAVLKITNASKIFADDMYDYSYSKMSARNKYLMNAKHSNNAIYNEGIKKALESGILRQSISNISNSKEWEMIKLDNGTSYYVKTKWKHQFVGSYGKEIRGNVGTILRVMKGAVDVVRNLYLVGSPAGYINSAISSLYSGMILSDSPIKFKRNLSVANNDFNEYIDLVQKKGRLEAKSKDFSDIQKKIDNHWINDAYENGIQATLRNAHKALGDFEKNQMLSALRYNRFFQTPKNIVDGMETIYLRPESNVGAKLGFIYDKSEIIPKLALLKTKMDEGLSQSDATDFVKMAFPDYNMNLPPELNFVGDFIPFLKFALNIPKIAMFTAEQRLNRLIGTKILGMAAVTASYSGIEGEGEDWYQDHDFARIADGVHLYTGSWSNVPNPLNIGASVPQALLDPVEISSKLVAPYNLSYGTWED